MSRSISVNAAKADAVFFSLLHITEGPAEAFAIIIVLLMKLNECGIKENHDPLTKGELVAEVAQAINSCTFHEGTVQ